jgi:hypothetical protein
VRVLHEQLPRQLVRELTGHEVSTVQQEGWAGLKNGDLLRAAAERRVDVFVTKDQNLEFQQNLAKAKIAVVIMAAPSHDIKVLRPLVPTLLEAHLGIQPGEVRRVAA